MLHHATILATITATAQLQNLSLILSELQKSEDFS
jgi:hypothetical protein